MTVSAEVLIANHMEAALPATTPGPRFFDYQDAQQNVWASTADWNTGTFDDTAASTGRSSVELASSPPFELCINSGGDDFTGADGTFYQEDDYFTGGGGPFYLDRPVNNTPDLLLWQTIRYAFTNGGVPTYTYNIPVPAPGVYEVEVGIINGFNLPPYQNQTDLTIEGVQVLDDFDPHAVTGGLYNPTWHTFTTTTPDSTVDLLVAHAGWYGALNFVCVRGAGQMATSGTWTSPVIDTLATGTNVFGLLGGLATTPPGTDVRYQLSFGATAGAASTGPFIGPDGTTATFYEANEPIAYGHDFSDRFVALRATLTSSSPGVTPYLDQASLSWDLAEIDATTSSLSVMSSPAGQTGWLARVRADDALLAGSTATISLLSSTGFGELEVGTDHPTTQVDIIAGTPVQTVGPPFPAGPANPHSIKLTETAMAGGTTVVRWQGEVNGVLVVHDFAISFF